MDLAEVRSAIDLAWDRRGDLDGPASDEVRDEVDWVITALDAGELRVEWVKKAVVLSFALNDMTLIEGGPDGATWWDKVPSKFNGWADQQFRGAGFRAVPGSIVRRGARGGVDAIVRQHRRPRRSGNNGRHLGLGGLMRPSR